MIQEDKALIFKEKPHEMEQLFYLMICCFFARKLMKGCLVGLKNTFLFFKIPM